MDINMIMLVIATALAAFFLALLLSGTRRKTDVRFTVGNDGKITIDRHDKKMFLRESFEDGEGNKYITVCGHSKTILSAMKRRAAKASHSKN